MNMKEYAFGIDLGGTTAKVGLFTTAGALLEKWEVPTDTSNAGEHILGNLAKAVKDKMQENGITAEQVEGVGVGVPGPVLDSRIVPIVCANLGGWGERNVSIQLSGLRESGSIEQDADIVMFLYREDYYRSEVDEDKQDDIDENHTELIVAKNRHGATGTIEMTFDKEFTRFRAVDKTANAF